MFDSQEHYPSTDDSKYVQCLLMFDSMEVHYAWIPENLAVPGKKCHLKNNSQSFKVLDAFDGVKKTGSQIKNLQNVRYLSFNNR